MYQPYLLLQPQIERGLKTESEFQSRALAA